MTLLVVLYAYGILKVFNPVDGGPIYLLVDSVCGPRVAGKEPRAVELVVTNPWPGDEVRPEVVGYVSQGRIRCDVEQVVVAGP